MKSQTLLTTGHTMMGVSFLVCLVGVAIAYVFYEYFALWQQMLAHIVLIVSPAILKIGYLIRLTALHQLGLAVD